MNRALPLLSLLLFAACSSPTEQTEQSAQISEYEIAFGKHLIHDISAKANNDKYVNVVVEIPAGTSQKWEVNKSTGNLEWEFRNGAPRTVSYLPYPGNYGFIPQTILPSEKGGDGDPLDVIVLGPSVERGSVIRCKIIGVLKLLDGGEQDDKLLAIMDESPLEEIDDLAELDDEFPGISDIIWLWFENYKGTGEMEALGFGSKASADSVLNFAIQSYTPESFN